MLKMVRPYSGSPRQKHRPFSQSYGPMHRMDHYGSHSRDQREFREFKALPWREPRGGGPQRGRPPYFDKEPRLADEWREPSQHFHRPLGQWRPQAQGRFHGYGPQTEHLSPEPHRGHRRLSPPRSSQSPPPHRRPPMQAPGNGPPAHKRLSPRVPLHGPHPGPRPPSPHHFHGSLRELSPMAHHGPYRGAHRRPGPSGEDRSRDHGACRDRSPGERLLTGRPEGNAGTGASLAPDLGSAGSQTLPRGSPRNFTDGVLIQRGCPLSGKPEGTVRERPVGRPAKRKHPECRPASPEFERCAKRARETPQRFQRAKVFGGRSLSLKDKSRLLKGRKLRAESETGDKPKAPPAPKPKHPKAQPPKEKEQEEKPCPSVRKARSAVTLQNEQPEAAKARALKKRNPKAAPHKIPSPPDTTCDSPQETETLTIKVDTRHTLTTHSSSPSDRQLSWDLVTVSRRGLGSRPEEKNSAPWRDRAKKTQTTGDFGPGLIMLVHQVKESFFNSHGNITLNERFSKLQNFTSSSRDQSGRYSGLKRQVDVPLLTTKPTKIMGPPQRPSFRPSSPDGKPPHFLRRPFPEPPGHFRRFGYFKRPLMNNLMARPHFQQKPMFRKSQSIMSKYRHLHCEVSLRHRGHPSHTTTALPGCTQSSVEQENLS
ncbi:hypothetical protein COCON_G00084410 [Conger conger]|uniref:Uncharacterized protein n=1 Tax=Conger conger TaxID=82655 RepID=A0A9Q1DQE8_CONCO|nr:hypothetical protein COCON_G00084410 [Conger conger]